MELHRLSPLFNLVKTDRCLAQVRDLLSRGEDPNSQSYGGFSLLSAAVNSVWPNDGVVRELINAGADVNMCTHLGITPLHFAILQGRKLAFQELIKSGASINSKDFLGRTALHYAVIRWKFCMEPIVFNKPFNRWFAYELLKHENIDIDEVDFDGNTPLMVAIKSRQEIVAYKLLQNNANPNICNKNFETPLHEAFTNPISLLHLYLLICGASIYSVDKKGQTPMDVFIKTCKATRTILEIPSRTELKIIIFQRNITDDLKRKLESFPKLSKFLSNCYDEVDQMRRDFISGNVTVHDFVWDSFNENQFENILLQIYKPVVDRLVRGDYPEYFSDILVRVPEPSLYAILEMLAFARKRVKEGKEKDLTDVLSIIDINHLICGHLFYLETFCLIVAFSNVRVPESMQNVLLRIPMCIEDILGLTKCF